MVAYLRNSTQKQYILIDISHCRYMCSESLIQNFISFFIGIQKELQNQYNIHTFNPKCESISVVVTFASHGSLLPTRHNVMIDGDDFMAASTFTGYGQVISNKSQAASPRRSSFSTIVWINRAVIAICCDISANDYRNIATWMNICHKKAAHFNLLSFGNSGIHFQGLLRRENWLKNSKLWTRKSITLVGTKCAF